MPFVIDDSGFYVFYYNHKRHCGNIAQIPIRSKVFLQYRVTITALYGKENR